MDKLTQYLRDKNLKQKDFASLIGVTPGAVSQWFAAARLPLERVARIHAVTGIAVHDLAPELFAAKSAVRQVRSRSQSKVRRMREPANA